MIQKRSNMQKWLDNEMALIGQRKIQQFSDIKQQYHHTACALRPSVVISKTVKELYNESKLKHIALKTILSSVITLYIKKVSMKKSNATIKVVTAYIIKFLIKKKFLKADNQK